jgi:TAG lipase/steryl ester hydrolase/phospholipase A2/LPA acyltransferase
MSFLSDTILPGSSQLHIRGDGAAGKNGKKTLRKSKSHAGFLTPLVHLIRNPGETLGSVPSIVEHVAETTTCTTALQDRKQLLNLRLKDVRTLKSWL